MKNLRVIVFVIVGQLLLLSCSETSSTAKSTAPGIEGKLEELYKPNSSNILVAAHRSAHMGNAENSLASVQHAIELGVDIIEIDIQVTKDSVVVLSHDRNLERTTNGTGKISDYTLEELGKFRLKLWTGLLSDYKIPTLEDVLLAAKGKILIDLDLKTDNYKNIVKTVMKVGSSKEVFYFSKDYVLLDKVKAIDENAIFMPRAYSYEMADSALTRFSNRPIVHIDPSFYTKEVVELIKKNNARVWINALGEKDCDIRHGHMSYAVEELLKNGANVIQTDEPEMLLDYLRFIGRHK